MWLFITICLFSVFTVERKYNFIQNYLYDDPLLSNEESLLSKIIWLISGFLVIVVGISICEILQPYYFLQDDNYSQFLPVIIQAGKSIGKGIFPTWNPYQLMGSPTTSVGIYSLTYPVTYISYFISKYVFRNEYLTIDVFSIIHLIGAYLTTYWAGRCLKIRSSLATLLSISYVLTGFNLIAGRSWYYMIPVAAWLPLIIILICKLQGKVSLLKWTISAGLILGIYFHAGNVQMWIYTVIFLIIAIIALMISKSITLNKAICIIPALIIALAIAMPLLYPQIIETSNTSRIGSWGGGIANGILAMILPYPLAKASNPNGWSNKFTDLSGQIYYSGTFFITIGLFAVLFILLSLILFKWNKKMITKLLGENIWLFIGSIAFIYALGNSGRLWTISCKFPIFNKFTNPFKVLTFVNLFFIIGGGLIVERFLCKHPINKRKVEIFIALPVICLLLYHSALARTSFCAYGDPVYPAMPKNVSQLIKTKSEKLITRLISLAPERCPLKGYTLSLKHNFPSIYQIYTIYGYDTFIQGSKENQLADRMIYTTKNIKALQAYGVQWIMFYDANKSRRRYYINGERCFDLKNIANRIVAFDNCSLWKLKGKSNSMAFIKSNPQKSLPIQFKGNGVRVQTTSLKPGDTLVINVLNRKWLKAYSDGIPIVSTSDKFGRVNIKISKESRCLTLIYSPPFKEAFFISSCLILIMLFVLIIKRVIYHRSRF
ncbi:MAG: hypothetical protein Q8880_09285 [Bacteroidota bacterium]|nr:hypothetical protein [Bacteroidota bacterium]